MLACAINCHLLDGVFRGATETARKVQTEEGGMSKKPLQNQYHHWVPQHYLRRFAVEVSKEKHLAYAILKPLKKQVRPNVKDICGRDNWNRISSSPIGPNAFEAQTARFDSVAAHAFKTILSTGNLPLRYSDHGNYMIEFVARLIVRNNGNRGKQVNFQDLFTRVSGDIDRALKSQEEWERYLSALLFARTGFLPCTFDYRVACQLHKDGELTFEFDQTPIIERELDAVHRLCEFLVNRQWYLRDLHVDAPDLITCDVPAQVWSGKGDIVPGYFWDTAVLLPITPRHLLASPGGPFMRKETAVTEDEALEINTRTFNQAELHIVSKQAGVELLDAAGVRSLWRPESDVPVRHRGPYNSAELRFATLRTHLVREDILFQ
jgi:Protein of unknown function (DUF4238)